MLIDRLPGETLRYIDARTRTCCGSTPVTDKRCLLRLTCMSVCRVLDKPTQETLVSRLYYGYALPSTVHNTWTPCTVSQATLKLVQKNPGSYSFRYPTCDGKVIEVCHLHREGEVDRAVYTRDRAGIFFLTVMEGDKMKSCVSNMLQAFMGFECWRSQIFCTKNGPNSYSRVDHVCVHKQRIYTINRYNPGFELKINL